MDGQTVSDVRRQFREPVTRPPRKRSRIMTIARRAQYLTGAWLGVDSGALREVGDYDHGSIAGGLSATGTAAGAAWVAKARGIR